MSSKDVIRILREQAVVNASKMLSDAQKAQVIADLKRQLDEVMSQQSLPLGSGVTNVKTAK